MYVRVFEFDVYFAFRSATCVVACFVVSLSSSYTLCCVAAAAVVVVYLRRERTHSVWELTRCAFCLMPNTLIHEYIASRAHVNIDRMDWNDHRCCDKPRMGQTHISNIVVSCETKHKTKTKIGLVYNFNWNFIVFAFFVFIFAFN